MSGRSARIIAVLLLLGLPLTSGWLAGFPRGFTELPPETVYVHPPAFSALIYAPLTLLLILAAALFVSPRRFGFTSQGHSDFTAFEWRLAPATGHRFPIWGWIGTVLIASGWAVAWSHPGWLGRLADHSFPPLWLGYVLVVDGLAYRRCGTSPLRRRTGIWLMWFPVSAVAWWYFELLNRFIQNWVYLGVQDFSPLRYVLGSTLAYSTVIPAVLTTAALLSSFDYFQRGFLRARPDSGVSERQWTWWSIVAFGAAGLALMPWFPIALFPVIWLSPLAITTGLLELGGVATGAGHAMRGDWGPVIALAAAAVICGFFWELWNLYAMPKWIYQIPWFDRFKLFEMPLVGYLGYLPFGPACWAFRLLLLPYRAPAASPRPDKAARDQPRPGSST